jgi:integrase
VVQHIFLPQDVERIRAKLGLRDAALVSVLAYSGPRPEEVVCRLTWNDVGEQAIRYVDTKRNRVRFTPLLAPLAEDLRGWFLASGRPKGQSPVFPAHDGGFWGNYDWRNWRRRVWQGEPERPRRDRKNATPARAGCAPPGTRPRDLRSSYVTLRVYEGVPLTQIAKRGRHQRPDDRAALRRGHRQLGRKAGRGRDANPPRASQKWTQNGRGPAVEAFSCSYKCPADPIKAL